MTLRNIPLLILAVALTACGFHLRGSNLDALKNSRVCIISGDAYDLALQVRRQLEYADVTVIKDQGQADYVITLGKDSFKRSVLSVSAETGKVEEYQLTYNTTLNVTDRDGKALFKNEPITAQRDYTFDEDSVLGKFDEENKLREDLVRSAADMVVRRLQAISR